MIRTIEDILGLPAMNLNDQWIRPMSAVFHNSGKSWDYQSIVPSILYTTQLPLPPADKARVSRPYTKPLHNAQYWSDRMRGMNFTVEDKLDTPRYNKALWEGLKGENVPYPAVRDGRNLRHNRKQRLEQYLQAEAKRQTKQVADLSKPASSGQ